MENELNTSWRCGYCWEGLGSMMQPKSLPCGHVFCLPCLQSDFTESPKLKCTMCRVIHEVSDLEALPSYSDFHKDINSCEDNVEMSLTSHQIQKAPHKSICPDHPSKKLKLACRMCHAVLCHECLAGSTCSRGHHHELVKMDEPCKKLTNCLDWSLTKLGERSSRMQELEKNILRLMEEKKKECEEMKAMVDRVANQQIRTIERESQKIKSEIDDYCKSCEGILEQYITDLSAAKDHLDSLIKNTNTMKQQKSIFKYSTATADAEAELEKGFPELGLKTTKIQRTLGGSKLECSLFDTGVTEMLRDLTKPVKEELRFISSGADLKNHRRSAKWASVEWTPDNLLLCCTDTKEIQCRDQDFNLLFSFPLEYTAAAPLASNFLLMNNQNHSCQVDVFANTFKKTKTISLNVQTYNSEISACGESFSIVANCKVHLFSKDGNPLLVLSFQGKISRGGLFGGASSSLDGQIISTKLHSDYILLQTSSSLYILDLKEGSQCVQICGGLDSPGGIAIDDAGYFYTTCRTINKICLHSKAGKVKELGHKELIQVGGLSVKGNKMVVACDKELKLFKLF